MKNKKKSVFLQKMIRGLVLHTKRSSLLLLTLILSTSLALAQNITVKGTVLDDLGDPLIGASVSQKGSTNGTMTDANGGYTLSIPGNATLVASFVGFINQEIPVNNRTSIDIKMVEDSKLLEEVVVTALGIKREAKALGYAVSEVKGDELTKGRDGNAIAALSGRMAGVDISTGAGGPMGSTQVVIRGNSQLTGSNQPLYVVDGVPMDNSQFGSATGTSGGYDLGDGVASINPADIESVSVLKGASASALYGSRASNGVVLITTKSGKGQQGLGIDFSTNVNAVSIKKSFDDYQRVYGQGTNGVPPHQFSSAQGNSQSAWGAKLDPNLDFYIYNGEKRSYENRNNNILDFFRTGVTYTNNLAVAGSSDRADFRASISDMRSSDVVPSSSMYRTTVMIRGGVNVNNKVKVEGRANYTKEGATNRPALSDSPNNIGNSIIGIAPNFDQKWLSENYKDELGRYRPWNGNKYRLNPYWIINEMSNKSHKDRMMGHIQLSYKVLPFLTVQGKVGTDWSDFRFMDFAPLSTDGLESGRMQQTSIKIQETNYEGLIMYNQRFLNGDLDVSAMIGGNIMQYRNESSEHRNSGQSIPGIVSITNYITKEHTVGDIKKQVNSAYGSVNLGYKSFLYLDATIRHDISSALAKGYNAYTYPSVSGSFVFTELAKEMFNDYALSFGKFRASWAKVGGDTDPYKLYNTYNLLPYSFGGKPLGQLASTHRMPNYYLKPTSTYSYEFGLDLRFLNNRLGIDFGYFNQTTNDQIMDLPISATSGYNAAVINAGKITNKGIELAINATPIVNKNFEWNININMSKLWNKIDELYPGIDYYQISAARWAGASVVAAVGERYGSIMGKKVVRTENGQIIHNAQGMPLIDGNVSVLGNGNHDFTLGINNSFRYRDFTLGFLLDMKFGGDIYSMSARDSHLNGTSTNTLAGRKEWYTSEEARMAANATQKDWVPTGGYVGTGVKEVKDADGNVTGYEANNVAVNPKSYWDAIGESPEPFIYDASYIKLREISFSYDLPKKLLAKTPLRAVTLSAYGRNLWIIHSNLKNIDPESSYNMSNGMGLEYGSLPSRRTYGFGLNVKF